MADRSDLLNHYKLREDIVYRIVEKEAILLDIAKGEHYSLNKTATEVVLLIEKGKSVGALLTYMANKYLKEKAVLEKDITLFINDLLQRNIILGDAL